MAQRGMDAVIAKSQAAAKGRKPVMKRKGPPGIAIMIAMGKPKPEMGGGMSEKMDEKMEKKESMREELDASKGEGLSKADKIAALEEKIGYLKAELALLQDESDDEMESEDDEMEDEDEDED